jgi:hypothetical protein
MGHYLVTGVAGFIAAAGGHAARVMAIGSPVWTT